MFTTDMLEKRDKRVVIDDVEYDVMYEMFQFMYSLSTPNIHKLAFELLEAADKVISIVPQHIFWISIIKSFSITSPI